MPNNDYILRSDVLQIECDLCIATHCKRDHQCVKAIRLNNLPAADVEPKQRWIPVTERLPEAECGEGQSCLTVDICGEQRVLYFDGGNWCWPTGEPLKTSRSFPVTHWMPLPEPPKEETVNEITPEMIEAAERNEKRIKERVDRIYDEMTAEKRAEIERLNAEIAKMPPFDAEKLAANPIAPPKEFIL